MKNLKLASLFAGSLLLALVCVAAIDFPSTPATGNTHAAAGSTWAYSGAAWTTGRVAPVTANVTAGAVVTGTQVLFDTATTGANIRATTSGTDPTESSGTLVTGALTLTTDTTYETISYANGLFPTVVQSFAYTIDTIPTLTSATVPTGGTDITLLFSEAVRIGAGGSGGWVPTLSGGAATFTYASGNTTTSLVYTSNRTINSGETGTLAYTQPGDGIEENAGYFQDVATIASATITNNSTVGAGPTYLIEENSEASGAGWTTGAGTPNWTYTPAIAGTYSLEMNGSDVTQKSFTSSTTVEIYFRLNITTLPSASTNIMYISGSGTTRARFKLNNAGNLIVNATSDVATSGTMSTATNYHGKLRYVSGGNTTVEFSTDGTFTGAASASFATQASNTGAADLVAFYAANSSAVIIDRILVLDGAIGNNP